MSLARARNLYGLLSLFLFALGLHATSLQVVDSDSHAITLTAAQIAKAPRTTVNVNDHDKPSTYF